MRGVGGHLGRALERHSEIGRHGYSHLTGGQFPLFGQFQAFLPLYGPHAESTKSPHPGAEEGVRGGTGA